MLATAELPAELRKLVFRKAEGNPFFVEEVLKSLLELGELERQNGGYRWRGRPPNCTCPTPSRT